MPIVKPLKNSPLRSLRKKQSSSGKNKWVLSYTTTILFATLVCTYMELFFTGKGIYSFPMRPFPDTYSIDIRFTLFGIPLYTGFVLAAASTLNRLSRLLLFLFIAFIMTIGEMASENLGLLVHNTNYSHRFSFIGYVVFMMLVWHVFKRLLRIFD